MSRPTGGCGPACAGRCTGGWPRQAALTSAARIEHWLAGGEPALACAAALLAADEAVLEGDDERARAHLLGVLAFARDHAEDAADVVALHERLATVELRLGRVSQARASLEAALELARPGPPAQSRAAAPPTGAPPGERERGAALVRAAAQVPGLTTRDRSRIALDVATRPHAVTPPSGRTLLRRAVEEADATDDLRAQVQARVHARVRSRRVGACSARRTTSARPRSRSPSCG